ncbi:MAG: hypothetical protein AAF911_02455 [Planctomycetota bacterium]
MQEWKAAMHMNMGSQISPPEWSKRDIIAKALHLSYRFQAIKGVEYFARNGYSFWELYDCLIFPNYKIEIIEDQDFGAAGLDETVLGAYDANENVALISSLLSEKRNDPRRIWTLAHEVLGHGVLHGKWLRDEFSRI